MKMEHLFKGVRRRPPNVSPPVEMKSPQRVFLPLAAGVKAVVEKGQEVTVGQVVGSCDDSLAAAVHSPVSGTVEGFENVTDVKGQSVTAIVIANNGENVLAERDDAVVAVKEPEALVEYKPMELSKKLDALGFDVSGTVGPKPYVSMNGTTQIRKIDYLIIKAVDCDPPVACNQSALAGAEREDMILGIKTLAFVSGAQKVILALPKDQVSQELEKTAYDLNWELKYVSGAHYPYAIDNLLIYKLTGREVFYPEGDPRDWGVAICAVPKVLELARCLRNGAPTIKQTFAVAGDVKKPQVFNVVLGTPLQEVIDACEGFTGEAGKVVLGGPMKGEALFDLSMPITKEMTGIFVQQADKMFNFSDHPCINCGRCVQVCPVNLIPGELGKLCEYNEFAQAAEKDLFQCIECGCCAYVCPAQRPLVQLFRYGKVEAQAERMEQ